jgi:hypothetical protein
MTLVFSSGGSGGFAGVMIDPACVSVGLDGDVAAV